jgi:hypothetical protein
MYPANRIEEIFEVSEQAMTFRVPAQLDGALPRGHG